MNQYLQYILNKIIKILRVAYTQSLKIKIFFLKIITFINLKKKQKIRKFFIQRI